MKVSTSFITLALAAASLAAPGGIQDHPLLRARADVVADGHHQTTKTSSYSSTTVPSGSSSSSSASPTGTPCAGNTAADRSVWCDYSINTDYYEEVPDTGVTREYWLSLEQTTLAPDGVSRFVQTINGTIPGPLIWAHWGDWLVIHVTNNFAVDSDNGTSIHWHGIRQNRTSQSDGVVSVTQCPTRPGETYTYKFRASQYGSSWYHSHFALQAWEGVAGPMIIYGPTTANYDEDLGNLLISDWTHQTQDELYDAAQARGVVPLDNGILNGTNVNGTDGDPNQIGHRFEKSIEPGKTYLLRLVNVAIDSVFKFMIDNHTLTVVAHDFVPIVPYQTEFVNIAMGQRYDVIFTANQEAIASDFWMRAVPQVACSAVIDPDNVKGILHYGSSTGTPTTNATLFVDGCVDEPVTSLVPYVQKDVGAEDIEKLYNAAAVRNTENKFRWTLNQTSLLIHWENPTLLQVSNNVTDGGFSNSSNLISLPNANEWIYLIIETAIPVPHPIHLHGHDFHVLSQGAGQYQEGVTPLNLANPPRRDVALLPASGHLVLAWITDNPGAWLMHCHIGWHTLEGFALQFLEREAEIMPTVNDSVLRDTCSSWNSYVAEQAVVQIDDSGI